MGWPLEFVYTGNKPTKKDATAMHDVTRKVEFSCEGLQLTLGRGAISGKRCYKRIEAV